jgi:hypothetical protein
MHANLSTTGRWLVLISLVGLLPLSAAPVIFKAPDPVAPDETALLFGDGVTPQATAEGIRLDDGPVTAPPDEVALKPDGAPVSLQVLQATDLSAKVLIPADWKPGIFAVQVKNADGASEWQFLNRPHLWWTLSGKDGKAAPGGELRIFGLNFGEKSRVWLQADKGTAQELPVKTPREYDLTVTVPTDAAPGHYRVWVHNGFGGQAGFDAPLGIDVAPAAPWPDQRFDAEKFGAKHDGKTDDTVALQAALAAAQTAGGGVVWLPRGIYVVTAKLVVPERTIVRGEGRDIVWLYVPSKPSGPATPKKPASTLATLMVNLLEPAPDIMPANAAPVIDCVLAGNGHFAVEDLSIIAQTAKRLIASPDIPETYQRERAAWSPKVPKPGDVTLRNLRLQHLWYAHRLQKGDPRRLEGIGPATISLRGPDCEISDCVIVSSGTSLQLSGATRDRVMRNQIGDGRQGAYLLWDFHDGVFEDNEILARDMEGTYGGVQQSAYHLLFRGNSWHDAYGCEREALSFDSIYHANWIGHVKMNGPTELALGEKTNGEWPPPSDEIKLAAVIVAGKGLGQLVPISVTSPTGATLDSPWKIAPDDTSMIVLTGYKSEVIVTDNHFADASVSVQLYSLSDSFIISHNTSERTGGSYAIASHAAFPKSPEHQRFSYAYFNQWIGNTFRHGFTFDQGPSAGGFLGVTLSQDPTLAPIVPVIGNRFEGNMLDDMTVLGLQTTGTKPTPPVFIGRDAIFEHNTWVERPGRLFIDAGNAYSLLRANGTDAIAPQIEDGGMGTVEPKP